MMKPSPLQDPPPPLHHRCNKPSLRDQQDIGVMIILVIKLQADKSGWRG